MNGIQKRVAGAESGRKLLQVLLLFTAARPIWSIGEISDALGLPQSMVYRYVALLREVGLMESAGGKEYCLTDLVRNLARAADAIRPPLAEVALPMLERVRDIANETAFLTRRSGWFVYVVQRVETTRPVRLFFERGQALPLHQGATSRLLLAAMSPAERQGYFTQFGIDRQISPELLSDDALNVLNQQGVTESFEEAGEGLWSVGASIRDEGATVGAIACAAPLFRVTLQQRRDIRQAVIAAAEEVGAALGKRATTTGAAAGG